MHRVEGLLLDHLPVHQVMQVMRPRQHLSRLLYLWKLRAVAIQKRSLADACTFMRRGHAHLLVRFEEGDMGEISGQKRQRFLGHDALLFLVPVLHLLPSHVGFLLNLFHCFWHGTLLCGFDAPQEDNPLPSASSCTIHLLAPRRQRTRQILRSVVQ